MALKTNYKNTIIDSATNIRQKFNMITNSDKTTSFEDVTTYSQIGDAFDAGDINTTNTKVNELDQTIQNLSASKITYDDTTTALGSKTIQEAIEALKKLVSDGKSKIASAITNKGVSTSADATFAIMATNISNIPNRNTDTYKPTSRSTSLDMGYNNVIRYVNTTSVPNTNSATFTPNTRAKHDMGETNAYRYVDTTSVPNTNSATYTPSSNGSALDMGATNTYRYVNTNTVYNSGYNNGKTAGTPKASIGPWFCTGISGDEFGCIYSQWAVGNYAHPCFCYGNDTGAGDNYHGDSPASNSYWTIINYDHHRLNITIAKACIRYDSNGNATSIAAGTTITGWESSNPYRYVWY